MIKARKFLLIADGSDESRSAAYFAARRARNTGGDVTILAVADSQKGFEHWIGVGNVIESEALAAAERNLQCLTEEIEGVVQRPPVLHLKKGDLLVEIKKLVESDTSISILVLGGSFDNSQPDPLINAIARGKNLFGKRSIPITFVPAGLSHDELKALT